VKIGVTGSQDVRSWSLDNQVVMMGMSFIILMGVGGSLVYNSKEIIIFQVILIIVVFVRWKYTKSFLNVVSGMNNGLIKISYSIVLIFMLGGSGFASMEVIVIALIAGALMPIVSS